MYTYNAHVISVYDGDTITVEIDLGFYAHLKNMKLRLYGINTPEIRGDTREAGLVARDALRSRILDKDVVVRTIRDTQEKYGRWLAHIEIDGEDINNWLVANNYAVSYMNSGD